GSTGNNVTVNASGVLDLNGFNDVVEKINLNGGPNPNITTGTGVLTINGGMTVTPFPGAGVLPPGPAQISGNFGVGAGTQTVTVTHNAALTTDFIISGTLSGAAANTLVYAGTGKVLYTGNLTNTFAGTTTVGAASELDLQVTGGGALAGPLVINGVVKDLLDNQINGAPVRVNSTGLLDLNNHTDTVGALTMQSGNVTTGASGLLQLGGNVTTLATAVPATITGNVSLGGV